MSKASQKARAAARTKLSPLDRAANESARKAKTFLNSRADLRMQIELAVPACLLWSVTHVVLKNPALTEGRREFFSGVRPHLEAATAEVFMGLPVDVAKAATHAAGWAAVHSYDCPEGGRAAGTLFLGAMIWLERILKTEYLVLAPGSQFDIAAGMLLADMERARTAPEGQHIFTKIERAAGKLATRMQERLEATGLYVGATQAAQEAA